MRPRWSVSVDWLVIVVIASGVGALVQMADPFFISQREQIAALATKYSIPSIYEGRPFTQAGGLISYGPSFSSVYNQIGSYVGKILKGTKTADLPIVQPTKFELVVNLKAARAIKMNVPESFEAAIQAVKEVAVGCSIKHVRGASSIDDL